MAYIDVLGLSDALRSQQGSKRYAEAVDSILTPIVRSRDEPWLVLNHVLTGEEVEVDLSLPVTNGSRITTVSDAILISVPFGPKLSAQDRMRRIFDCLHAVRGVQRSLLVLGLRTRGGISIGGLIHKSHLVVGDGLVRSYMLESKTAIFPRVVIDRDIIRILVEGPFPQMMMFRNRIAHTVRQDLDGAYFIDYIGIDPVFSGTQMGNHVIRICDEIHNEISEGTSLRVEQKLRWLINYIFAVSADLKSKSEQRKDHAKSYFSNRYFRSPVNLKDILTKIESGEMGLNELRNSD